MATARLNDSRIGGVLGEDLAVRATARTFASPHAAHGVALFIGVERDVEIGSVKGRAVLVPADHEHAVASPGATIGICFDPERLPRVAGHARRAGGVRVLDGRIGRSLVEAACSHRAQLSRPDVLEGLGREAASLVADTPVRVDSRVARVVEALRDPRGELPHLAISDAHLQDLFVRDVGVPIRSFRLWRRLLRALALFATADTPASATTAAHAAGFADLAHFSRTCRRMLGYSPTTLRDGV
jgi:hypothetical protein